jgi:hypothetical protein
MGKIVIETVDSYLSEKEEIEESRIELDKMFKKAFGGLSNLFVQLVISKIIQLCKKKGIIINTSLRKAKAFLYDQEYYEIDLLLIGDDFAVAVDIRSSLSVEDVKEHLERLDKIKKVAPRRIDLSNISLFGAVAGMIIEEGADRYAYQKGLFVLRQKGNIVEIANDEKFKPKIWKTEY